MLRKSVFRNPESDDNSSENFENASRFPPLLMTIFVVCWYGHIKSSVNKYQAGRCCKLASINIWDWFSCWWVGSWRSFWSEMKSPRLTAVFWCLNYCTLHMSGEKEKGSGRCWNEWSPRQLNWMCRAAEDDDGDDGGDECRPWKRMKSAEL